ncbi:MAG: hypothetical protein A2Z03_12195 [Chloroflexi bacterium RBG_16_56_8]|nr:MAG: hypothetical protein A2Z03_12195 [Chloroflexi bacterium RBG_16_56_8]
MNDDAKRIDYAEGLLGIIRRPEVCSFDSSSMDRVLQEHQMIDTIGYIVALVIILYFARGTIG